MASTGTPIRTRIEWLCRARDGEQFTLELTNENMKDPKSGIDIGAAVRKVLDKFPNSQRTVVYGAPGAKSVKADLLDPVKF